MVATTLFRNGQYDEYDTSIPTSHSDIHYRQEYIKIVKDWQIKCYLAIDLEKSPILYSTLPVI